jgi:phage N-6-adenine-methyltransferase
MSTDHPETQGRRAEEWQNRAEIPADIAGAVSTLTDLAGLVSARHWAQAAVVYAFTLGEGRGEHWERKRREADGVDDSLGVYTDAEFASLGIRGLASHVTVRRYRRAWEKAMEMAACQAAEAGATVDLPDLDWDEMVKEGGGAHVGNNAGDSEWYTPREIIEAVRAVLGQIDLDPCSTKDANEVVGATLFYDVGDDGLMHEWNGTVFMNPPYSQPAVVEFTSKLVQEHTSGRVTAAIVLVNNATETDWWQNLGIVATGLCFPRGRVKFWHPDKESAPLQGQAILFLGEDHGKFNAEFSRFGLTW